MDEDLRRPESAARAEGYGVRGRGKPRRAVKYLALVLVGLLGVLATQSLWNGSGPAAAAARRLRDGDAAKRIAAIDDLERFGPYDPGVAIPALRSSLKDEEARVRASGALALVMVVRGTGLSGAAQPEARRAVAALFENLKDPEANARASAVHALWLLASLWEGPAGVVDRSGVHDALIEAAADPDATVRHSAVHGLGAIGPKLSDDPPPALPAALEDTSDEVRTAAADALARFPKGLPRLLPSLVRSFEKARPGARPAYALVLNRIRPWAFSADAVLALGSALSSPDDEVRCSAASALRAFSEMAYPAIPALAASIGRPGRERMLPSGPAPGKPSILTPDEELWWTTGPGSSGGNDPALASARALLRVLPRFGFSDKAPPIDPKSFRALTEVLGSGTPEVRATVAYALGRFQPTPAVVPVLGEAVRDPDATVRAAALKALHDIGDRMPFVPPETFKAALEDESPGVRYWAAGALGHIRLGVDPYIPELLEHAEHDPDRDVRDVCAFEIQEFIRPTAVTPTVVPVLIKALDSPAQNVRCAACGLLAKLGPASTSAIPQLIRLLKENAGNQGDRSQPTTITDQRSCAATALGRIAPGTPLADQAASALIEVMQTEPPPSVANQVVGALPGFGPLARGAIPRLRELAKSSNRNLSESAQQALTKLEAHDHG
jgi:HEAT repeat protein